MEFPDLGVPCARPRRAWGEVQAGKPALKKNASKAHILDALFASAKRPKAPKFEAPKATAKPGRESKEAGGQHLLGCLAALILG